MTGPVEPAVRSRRSFVYRALREMGAVFAEHGDAAVAWHYGAGSATEAAAARALGLADLSPLPRTGFKGADALAWLAEQGLRIGEASNRAYRQADGTLAAKLAPTEALILPGLTDDWDGALDAAWREGERLCYPVPRRDGSLWFRVTGTDAAAMFAKLCGVDLRPGRFANHDVAQTSVARINGIVIRDDIGAVPAYHLLADSASAAYLWRCLADAMAECDGRPVGLASLLQLAEPQG